MPNTYIVVLALFVWLRFIPFNLFWKLSPVIVLLVLLIGLFIPMQWRAPSVPAAVLCNSVQIVPAPKGDFSRYVRAYWPKPAITDGAWTPPPVQ